MFCSYIYSRWYSGIRLVPPNQSCPLRPSFLFFSSVKLSCSHTFPALLPTSEIPISYVGLHQSLLHQLNSDRFTSVHHQVFHLISYNQRQREWSFTAGPSSPIQDGRMRKQFHAFLFVGKSCKNAEGTNRRRTYPCIKRTNKESALIILFSLYCLSHLI